MATPREPRDPQPADEPDESPTRVDPYADDAPARTDASTDARADDADPAEHAAPPPPPPPPPAAPPPAGPGWRDNWRPYATGRRGAILGLVLAFLLVACLCGAA